jgi:calcium-dependent protein kinase
MRSLDHPNIIKVYEVYDYQDEYTLILEAMSGGELYKKVKGKKLPERIARIYMKQIIRTLIYLHSQGIVHRDLKPENMLFESEGSDTLKIIDFGIAAKL